MEKTLYLIRHCEAEGNINRIFHGNYDSDITENGLRQLKKLRERFEGIHLDAVYASPLRRAKKTAQAVAEGKDLDIKICPNLIEINGGDFENKPWSDFPLSHPEQAHNWVNTPHLVKMPGGENMNELYDRIWKAVKGIAETEKDAAVIAAVSHGCAIRAFLCRALGYGIERLNDVQWCDNTAVSTIIFDDELNCRVQSMNDSSHLDEDISTISKQNWFRNKEDYFES